MCKTHSTHTFTNINSTESPFISLILRHIQLESMLICTKRCYCYISLKLSLTLFAAFRPKTRESIKNIRLGTSKLKKLKGEKDNI